MSVMCVANAVRLMSMLEPAIIMPELLERAQGGLEVVNETHRTTAVLNILQGLAMPLVNEKIWLGGQKHILPLLELCLPGIDLVSLRTDWGIHLTNSFPERSKQDNTCNIVHNGYCAAYQDWRSNSVRSCFHR